MARILIVEDDKYLNKLLSDRFILEGFDVTTVLDGELAWEHLQKAQSTEQRFDLVLSDMLLPGMMGAELFAKIHELGPDLMPRVIAMSGIYKNPTDIREISKLYSLESYWTKPFNIKELVCAISKQPSDAADRSQQASSGRLAERSIEHLFLDAYGTGFTGKLVVKRDDLERRIYFSNGFPVSADSTSIAESLGRTLLTMGLITQKLLDEASQRMVEEKLQFGQMLIKMQALTKEQLFDALRKHSYRVLVNTFSWRDGLYEFLPLKELPAYILALEFNFILLMLRAHKGLFTSDFLKSLFETKKDMYCELSERAFQILPLFNLDEGSLHFFRTLPGNETLASVLRPIPALNHEAVFRVFYLLDTLGLLEWKLEPGTNRYKDTPHADFTETFESEKAASEDVAKALQAEYMDLLNKDYFEILEVTPESSHADIEESYRATRYRLHPDRFGKTLSGQTKRILDDMLARIDRAYQTLIDPEGQRSYVATIRRLKEDSIADSKKFLDAQQFFREGLRYLGQHQFEKAKILFDNAHKKWDRGIEYRLYSLFTEFKIASARNSDEAEKALQALKSEAALHRTMDTSYLLLGHAYLNLGKNDLAKEAYQIALKNNDKNDEAANALAKLGDAQHKKIKLSKAVARSKTGLKNVFYFLLFIAGLGALYFERETFFKRETGIQVLDPKEIETIFPAISFRQKIMVAKIVVPEGWTKGVPDSVLTSKCIDFLQRMKTFGIIEAYIFEEKAGLKVQCQNQKIRRF
jgi:CheY-like chemotaxis protein